MSADVRFGWRGHVAKLWCLPQAGKMDSGVNTPNDRRQGIPGKPVGIPKVRFRVWNSSACIWGMARKAWHSVKHETH